MHGHTVESPAVSGEDVLIEDCQRALGIAEILGQSNLIRYRQARDARHRFRPIILENSRAMNAVWPPVPFCWDHVPGLRIVNSFQSV